MNRIIVNVPDEKMQAFEEAMRGLGIQRTADYDFEVPEWHKKIVLDRVANYKPGDGRDWDELKQLIKFH